MAQQVVSFDGGFVSREDQCGFSLIELIVVVAITSLMGTWAASTWMQHAEDTATRATGVWMLSIKQALDQMLTVGRPGWDRRAARAWASISRRLASYPGGVDRCGSFASCLSLEGAACLLCLVAY